MHGKIAFGDYRHEFLKAGTIKVHPKIQRSFDEGRAKKIEAEFDPKKFGSLSVVINGSGHYMAFDGQHRLKAVQEKFGPEQMVPCHVFKDLPLEVQADMSIGINDAKPWKAIDKWPVRRTAQDPTVLEIEKILKTYGTKIEEGGGDGYIRAVAAVEDIYAKPKGPEILSRTLNIVTKAWGLSQEGFDNTILRGMAFLLRSAGSKLNDDGLLAGKLASHGTPRKLIGEARDYAEFSRTSATRAMAQVIVNTWNKRKREDQQIKL